MTTADLAAIRIDASNVLSIDALVARCMKPGCAWRMNFSGAVWLPMIIETCQQHPCVPDAADRIAELERTVADLRVQLSQTNMPPRQES